MASLDQAMWEDFLCQTESLGTLKRICVNILYPVKHFIRGYRMKANPIMNASGNG